MDYISGVGVILINKRYLLILKRSNKCSHPGEMCLPGGMFENKDITLLQTVIREVLEETNICLLPSNMLNTCDELVTSYGLRVRPFIFSIKYDIFSKIKLNEKEIVDYFLLDIRTININDFIYNKNFKKHDKCLLLKEYKIWGITASILFNNINIINEIVNNSHNLK